MQHEAEAIRALRKLQTYAYLQHLDLTRRGVYEIKPWWRPDRRIAVIRLWQHGAGNKLFVTRIHDTEELRLLLGYANLTGWEINE